jgi:Ca2+-binding RTX toxin-like protein
MSIAVPQRARRALLAAALPAALAATALPASADAATVRVTGGQLQYTAAAGENNNTVVAFTRTHIHIRDSVPITVGDGCVLDETGAALCVPGSAQARYALGNGFDVMRYQPPHPAQIDMGADNDTYFGALRDDFIGTNGQPGIGVQNADVIGGAGNDLITYRLGGGGVRVSLDGQFNDGDRGKENIRADFEHIEGSNGIDTLTGSNDPNKTEQYTALAGNDTVNGLDGTDIFNEGSAPNGADRYAGQAGIDRIDYSQRSAGVTIDMASLAANSGAPGEGDFIDPNTNDAIGTPFVDTMLGGSGANVFSGGGSGDTLRGNGGDDTLNGGTGADSLFGGADNDTLNTNDNVADKVMSCESGTDDVLNRDLKDVEATGCETVNSVGILKLAPTAMSVEAGTAAKLRMSWSHPKSWKQLRKVELRIEDAGKVVVRPAAKRLEDSGAVQVLRTSRLTTKGKTVTAHLALKLGERLAGETLSVDVQATDVNGKRQLQRDAGTITVN